MAKVAWERARRIQQKKEAEECIGSASWLKEFYFE